MAWRIPRLPAVLTALAIASAAGAAPVTAPLRPGATSSPPPLFVLPTRPRAAPSPPVTLNRPLFTPLAPVRPAAAAAVMPGIDVLEADHFAALRGKRIGLLTHAAGVDRRGVSTVQVLRFAPGVRLVELFAVEHGLKNDSSAQQAVADSIDPATGLRVISLYKGNVLKPTPAQLRPIDALVIDLQDVGTRSYTYAGAMKLAMEACFEAGKEVIVLDRPNPLGGLTVDGPLLDPELMSDVGRFLVPYVHGLTIGELARMVRYEVPPGGLALSARARARGKLTVIPMRGWHRSMRWPDTGLRWVPPSTGLPDYAAAVGYAMTGLGCIVGGFSHGLGAEHLYTFRAVTYHGSPSLPAPVLERDLRAAHLPGLGFRLVSAPVAGPERVASGVYVDVVDPNAWRPTALSFELMKLACAMAPRNPFAAASLAERRTFAVHVGSTAFLHDLVARGRAADIDAWLRRWRAQDEVFQAQSRRFWLYR